MSAYPPAPPPGAGGPVGPGMPSGQPGAAPVCPRHPDQVSYVTCQRCGRPACPECQRTAPVGVHCVDCATSADRAAGPERSRLGGRMRTRPYVTITMMALCVGVFLLGLVDEVAFREPLIFSPLAGSVEPWRMLTTAFLHAGVLHLAVNMYALWITGPFLEQLLGTWRFLALYLVAAFGGTVAVLLLTPYDLMEWSRGTVGASGAVFGLFAAVALTLRRVGGDYRQILVVIGINVVISFTIPNISWQAHLGGMLVGAAITALYLYLPKRWRTTGAIMGLVGIGLLLIGATAVAYAVAGLWF